ncbi:MAG: hypothetical protein IKS99_05285 [Firmicutes bacterium]|nr:hypothetical protein [Bacillota bacterium]
MSRRADLTALPKEVIIRMLSGSMKCVLPLSVVNEEGRVIGVYDLSDTFEVSGSSFGAVGILELTERIVKMLEELKDNLIRPEEVVLNKEVLFIDMSERETRLCLIPEISPELSEKENVARLLCELKTLTDDKGRAYMDCFIGEYLNKRHGTGRLLYLLEKLKREAGME